MAESECRENNELPVIPIKLSADLGTTSVCEILLLCEGKEGAERGRAGG